MTETTCDQCGKKESQGKYGGLPAGWFTVSESGSFDPNPDFCSRRCLIIHMVAKENPALEEACEPGDVGTVGDDRPLASGQSCGCDPAEHWVCEQHRVEVLL